MTHTLESLKASFLKDKGISHSVFVSEIRALSGIPREEIPDYSRTTERHVMDAALSDPASAAQTIAFYEKYYNEVKPTDIREEFDFLVYRGATLCVYVDDQWFVKCPDSQSTTPLQTLDSRVYAHTQGEIDLNKWGYDVRIFRRKLK